jgi:CRISPR-associated protein Csd1
MPAPESSPLRALDLLYERLAGDARYEVARPGYSSQRVSFCVVLNLDGSLSALQDERQEAGKKKVMLSRRLTLPGQAKPSGVGLNPGFLWDTSTYLLGHKADDSKPERTLKAFAAFRDRHIALEASVADAGFSAVCAFLRKWEPGSAVAVNGDIDEITSNSFGVFRLSGEHAYIHDRPAVRAYWDNTQKVAAPGAPTGQCLITGKRGQPLARIIEPAIKGVRDAQPSGAKIVAFNRDAFTSYRPEHKEAQALVAPISQDAAFRHATALNALLVGPQSRAHRAQVGSATTVFWTDTPTDTESVFAAFLDGPTPDGSAAAQDDSLRSRLGTFFDMLRAGGGRPLSFLSDANETPFYVLGLAPNDARLSVRYWHAGSLGGLWGNLAKHFEDLRMERPPGTHNPEFPSAAQLLAQTVRKPDRNRKPEDVSPAISGPLLSAVLTGGAYPPALAHAVLVRIRAEREVNYLRACILKAFLNRNHRQRITMSLDLNQTQPGYLLGRLFSALEKTQEEAMPGINATICDRFYSSASTTPMACFPGLFCNFRHHLAKVASSKGVGMKVNRERLVQSICDSIGSMPAHLGLEGQSLFALGYYHQRQAFFCRAEQPAPAM